MWLLNQILQLFWWNTRYLSSPSLTEPFIFVEIVTSLQAELHAIYNGICLENYKSFNNVVIESDSTIVIGLAEHNTSHLHL
jgi:hypothetical protein